MLNIFLDTKIVSIYILIYPIMPNASPYQLARQRHPTDISINTSFPQEKNYRFFFLS